MFFVSILIFKIRMAADNKKKKYQISVRDPASHQLPNSSSSFPCFYATIAEKVQREGKKRREERREKREENIEGKEGEVGRYSRRKIRR